jgi:hypothetical protein
MQSEHVAIGVIRQCNESILSDGHLLFLNAATGLLNPTRLCGAIRTTEVNQNAVLPEGKPGILTREPDAPEASMFMGKANISIPGVSSGCSLAWKTDS